MKPNTKCVEEPQFTISTHPLSEVPSFSEISQSHGQNQQISKQCCLPPLSFKISLRDKSFHISLNCLGFYLFPQCLLNFLWLVYSTMCGKSYPIYGVHIPRKCIESMHFYSYPSPSLKTPGRIFWKSVSPKTKVVQETMICFIRIKSENMKMTWNVSLFIFCIMICNFSKCDGFTIL